MPFFEAARNFVITASVVALPVLYVIGFRKGSDGAKAQAREKRNEEQKNVADIYREMADGYYNSETDDLRTNRDLADRLRRKGL